MCFPSIVKDGVCLSANNIDPSWIGTDLKAAFEEHLRRPVTVVNDADAAGLAEARYGAGRGVRGLVHVITLGTGIGGAMIHDGVLVPNFEVGSLELDGVMAESRASAKARERDQLSWAEYAERLQRFFSHVERIFSPDLFIVGGGKVQRAALFQNEGITFGDVPSVDDVAAKWGEITDLSAAQRATFSLG